MRSAVVLYELRYIVRLAITIHSRCILNVFRYKHIKGVLHAPTLGLRRVSDVLAVLCTYFTEPPCC